MCENLYELLEKEVQPFNGKVIRDCDSREKFLEEARKAGASKGYGFYNPKDKVGIVFPGLDQAYSLGAWKLVSQVLPEEIRDNFNLVSLEEGEVFWGCV